MFATRGKSGDWGNLGPQGVYIAAKRPETVDSAWMRIQAFDEVEVLNPLHDTDYESHQFEIRDRDDNLWSIGTYRGA